MKVFFLTIILLALAILMLGVKVFFVKGGKFPSGHAHHLHKPKKEQSASK